MLSLIQQCKSGFLKIQTKSGFIHEFTRIFANSKSSRGKMQHTFPKVWAKARLELWQPSGHFT
jgi:hypothetical protein